MKKVFILLAIFLFFTALSAYAAYEDFFSYHGVNGPTYSKHIDKCNAETGFALTNYTFLNDAATTSLTDGVTSGGAGFMSYTTLLTKEGGKAFIWDKSGATASPFSVYYTMGGLGIANFDEWKGNSNITFWYYVPTSAAAVTMVDMNLCTSTTFVTNYINSTQTSCVTGWNYFKRSFFPEAPAGGDTSVLTTYPTFTTVYTGTATVTITTALSRGNYPTYTSFTTTTRVTTTGTAPLTVTTNITQSNFPDYTFFRSYRLGIKTNTSTTTITGLVLDDIRVVDKGGWTGSVWNDIGGVWKNDLDGTDYVYAQLGDCSSVPASSMVSPTVLSNYGAKAFGVAGAVPYTDYLNFSYSARIKFKETATPYGGIAFRYSTPNKYYLFNLDESAQSCQLLKIDGVTASPTITTLATASTAVTVNTSYYLKVICQGSSIKAFKSLDGVAWGTAVLEVVDASLTSGKVGLFAGGPGTKKVFFDDVKVLPIPALTSAVAKENLVELAWSTVEGRTGEVESYNIYRKELGTSFVKIGTSTAASFIDTTAKGETTYSNATTFTERRYTYSVSANIAESLGEGELSNELSAVPNPSLVVKMATFTPTTGSAVYSKVSFSIYNPTSAAVELKIFDVGGSLVKTISGTTSAVDWDGKDEAGTLKESGVYIYQVKVGGVGKGTGTVCLAR